MLTKALFRTPKDPSAFGISPKGRMVLVIFLLCAMRGTLWAQTISVDADALRDYNAGLEHVQKKKYAAAQQRFDKALENPQELSSIELENAEHYRALCGMQLFNDGGDVLMERFVSEHPEHAKIEMAYYHLGCYAFTKKKYSKVIKWFAKADASKLSRAEQEEFHFKLGYAHFQANDHDKALKEFELVGDDIEGPYYAPITYYTAYILFSHGAYDEAYERFSLLEGDATFGKIVPLYVLQILQAQGKDEEVVAYGERLMGKKFNDFSKGNLHKMIGEAYYQMGEFSMAVPYLEEAYGKLNWDREEVYRLAYACYKAGQFEKAAMYFEQCTKEKDPMAQLAYYLMADAYLQSADKMAARNAFKLASDLDFDRDLQETAIFNYAKLSFELSFDPNGEAIAAFEKYVDEHLGSERADEAQELILKVQLSTQNFEGALATLDKIKKKTAQHRSIYQQTALKRGIELFNDGNFERAIAYFEKAYQGQDDRQAAAEAMFWQAEAHASLRQFDQAIELYERHVAAPLSDKTKVYALAHYGLGYAQMAKKRETEAINAFLGFLSLEHSDNARINDAYLRIGDCYYVQKNTGKAIAYYNKAIDMHGAEADYALFQVAMCHGLQGKSSSKISKLKSLISGYPNSEFVVDAKYEIGETYFFSDDADGAVAWFDRVINENPKSQYVSRSMLNKGLILYNKNDDERALPLFKRVATDFPGTSEATEALQKVQKIYVENGQVKVFEDYLAKNKFPDATKGSLDTSYFEAAQLMFQRGEYVNATQEFGKYLGKFPNGYFALDAHYYKAEAELQLKKYPEALKDFNYVLEYSKTSYTERALVSAAQIHMYQGETKEAQAKYALLEEIAERSENKLEARVGLMHTHFELKEFDRADEYASKVLKSDRVEANTKGEARLIAAKCALGMGNDELALAKFQETVANAPNAYGAEAMFNIAQIHFHKDNYTKSKETVFEIVNRFANYTDWIGKSFLLLADNYMKEDDYFQAKLTLQNVMENYQGEIKQEAENRLREVEKFEAFSSAP